MKVLQIGLAELIAKQNLNKLNDPQIHQIKYGERIFEQSFIIVKTPRSKLFKEFYLSPNVKVLPTLSRNKYLFFRDAWGIGRMVIKKHPIDLIITQDPFITGLIGYLLKKEFHLPLNVHNVCDFIDNSFWIKEWWVNRIFNPIGKFILKRADTIRVDSGKEQEKLISLGIKKNRIWNIPFVLNDADMFKHSKADNEFRNKILRGKYEHAILFVGRFEDQKDLPTLFKTARKVVQYQPKALFIIIGDGKKSDELKTMAERLGIKNNLLFEGWVDYFDLPKYYAACDAFILTSKYETSPRVIIFACLSRKPIVATDVSGVSDFVEEGKNGFVVPVGDEEGLTKGVLALIGNSEKAKKMGEYGLNKVKELLNEEKILEDYKKMWEFTINSGNDRK